MVLTWTAVLVAVKEVLQTNQQDKLHLAGRRSADMGHGQDVAYAGENMSEILEGEKVLQHWGHAYSAEAVPGYSCGNLVGHRG